MKKFTKKTLLTVLVLSLLVGFSVSVASFASEESSEGHGPITEEKYYENLQALNGYEWLKREKWWLTEDAVKAEAESENKEFGPMTEEEYYESLTDEVVGNDYVALKFNPRRVPPGFAKYADTSLGVQLWKNPNCGWAIVGDILCYFGVNSSNEYSLKKIIPLFYDESGKACHLGGEPIKVIKIPDYVNRHPVTDMGVYALERITELFPDLECVILPRTLKYLFSEFDLHPKYSRPLKIYVPRGTNYRYIWDDDIPLQSGLHHVMQPLNWGISRDFNAFSPTEPPADPWCTIM